MRLKRVLTAVLAAVCLLGCLSLPGFAAKEGFDNFQKTRSYTPGQFSDVALDGWYTPYVAQVYELGLMQGNGVGGFCPGGNVTLAETAALAARLHSLYFRGSAEFRQGEPWYQVYLDYCRKNGILNTDFADYDQPATRRQFAAILAAAFPANALPEMNLIADGEIPDVAPGAENAAEIYRLYRAGILTGNDKQGTFLPDTGIRRSEVAAVIIRMALPAERKSVSLSKVLPPELEEQSPAEDGFFADAAMLGNSLVDGMMLYSGLRMDYYGGTGLTVYKNKADTLLQKRYGKIYIEFGINEVGASIDSFINAYRKIVEKIRTQQPDAQVYLMAITPVTKAKNDAGTFTMKTIGAFNEAIYALAEETGCWYLDTCGGLCDDSGYLPAAYAGWDGSPHLEAAGYKAWADLIRRYYAE